MYASSEEIFGYFSAFADKHSLRRYIQTSQKVTRAEWDPSQSQWNVEVTNELTGSVSSDSCHILINAGGILNAWKWPSIPGFEEFDGPKLHTAAWDDSVDLKGKVVGLIGNG